MQRDTQHASSFAAVLAGLLHSTPWKELQARIAGVRAADVEHVLARAAHTPADLTVLLSPAAEPFLEEMARRAHALTLQRFGRTVLMYVPLYVSNYCINRCRYCGFNAANEVQRHALTVDEAVRESELLREMGFRHILLVSGEHPDYADVEYLRALCERIRHRFASLCVEVRPLSRAEYTQLIEAGVDCVTCYQETYAPEAYAHYHPGGPKRDYTYRLATLERAARAGMRKVGLGPLYGLSDWRVEALMAGLHAHYLMQRYWRTQVSISFPRLRHAAGGFEPPHPLPDEGLAQVICALRLALPDAHLVMSTREPAALRDRLLPLGITQMSAASRTAPHGYSHTYEAECQFNVMDTRRASEVAAAIRTAGYEPVWKDWDENFLEETQ